VRTRAPSPPAPPPPWSVSVSPTQESGGWLWQLGLNGQGQTAGIRFCQHISSTLAAHEQHRSNTLTDCGYSLLSSV
jgi:hypothetical protein